jgi:hypothetical protein
VHGGPVADGELVIAGGHRPVPLEPVDPALHRMPQSVGCPVEGWRPAAPPAPGPPVGGLVILFRDRGRMPRQRRYARLAREL